MSATLIQYGIAVGGGSLIGFLLGLVGGGGSVLAVPLLVYCVGVADPHVAIGTSALAVAANAGFALASHARRGTIRVHCAGVFACAGVVGALLGAAASQTVDGQRLLILFALLMCVAGVLMMRGDLADDEGMVNRVSAWRLSLTGCATGALCGFFGIGGGFLIVPALTAATGMPVINAIGSSLVAVTAFGVTTALVYARADWVDWPLAVAMVAGGALGGAVGSGLALRLATRRGVLNRIVGVLILAVAASTIFGAL